MLNKFETIAGSEARNRPSEHQPTARIITSSSDLFSSLSYKYMLMMIVTCLVGSLTTTIAYSQELPRDSATLVGSSSASGWWPAEKAESETASQLIISMAEPTDIKGPYSVRTAGAELNSDRQIGPTEAAIAGLPHFGLMDGSAVKPSPLTDRISLVPLSSFAFLQSEYSMSESTLLQFRSLTEVNGATVHPLLRINYAGWQLPVTLYTSSLRDREAR